MGSFGLSHAFSKAKRFLYAQQTMRQQPCFPPPLGLLKSLGCFRFAEQLCALCNDAACVVVVVSAQLGAHNPPSKEVLNLSSSPLCAGKPLELGKAQGSRSFKS